MGAGGQQQMPGQVGAAAQMMPPIPSNDDYASDPEVPRSAISTLTHFVCIEDPCHCMRSCEDGEERFHSTTLPTSCHLVFRRSPSVVECMVPSLASCVAGVGSGGGWGWRGWMRTGTHSWKGAETVGLRIVWACKFILQEYPHRTSVTNIAAR